MKRMEDFSVENFPDAELLTGDERQSLAVARKIQDAVRSRQQLFTCERVPEPGGLVPRVGHRDARVRQEPGIYNFGLVAFQSRHFAAGRHLPHTCPRVIVARYYVASVTAPAHGGYLRRIAEALKQPTSIAVANLDPAGFSHRERERAPVRTKPWLYRLGIERNLQLPFPSGRIEHDQALIQHPERE